MYGAIELDDMVLDIVRKCPELIRLKYIGMMNFKSISMLPLTSITRLEHSIGLAYLCQVFSESIRLPSKLKNELLVAALYPDVTCGGFGHSIEWAIDRYTPFEHEKETEWVSSESSHPYFSMLPCFIEMPGLHKYKFKDEYSPDFNTIHNLINGAKSFIINNNGIDLDNIDNVFRMALYLGLMPSDIDMPIKLVKSLRLQEGFDNFITNNEGLEFIKLWQDLRSEVYRRFIYSNEYMAFEYLVFYLVRKFSENIQKEDIRNLFHFSDEKLLWFMYEKGKGNEVSNIAKRILTHDIPYTYAIIRTCDYSQKAFLTQDKVLDNLTGIIIKKLRANTMIKDSAYSDIFLHVTTDNRKTNRKIEIYVDNKGDILKESLDEDKQYIVIGILGNKSISSSLATKITSTAIRVLEDEGFGAFEHVQQDEKDNKSQEKLFY